MTSQNSSLLQTENMFRLSQQEDTGHAQGSGSITESEILRDRVRQLQEELANAKRAAEHVPEEILRVPNGGSTNSIDSRTSSSSLTTPPALDTTNAVIGHSGILEVSNSVTF